MLIVGSPANLTKVELMKLCELPLSTSTSITLSCTLVLSFMQFMCSELEIAFVTTGKTDQAKLPQ
jgi:hypothetical protein